ncbi:hypothetical protein Dsin_014411 [Dipteronia sinensis]|uniref:Hydroxyproline-rich glycoprotein family protein n=1 Tax=Dipteronia sinensis TaxID=43782 RepID=A0AAE0ALX7_9ROSI|nr:hypothetical protein Dsin_014411 [Dipteronia sinensis]
MEDDQEDMSPFWQPSRRRRRPSSSFFFNSGFLLILLLSLALIFLFIIIPSFISFTSQVMKPNSVKKSWDSLNLVLVLFAVVCGFLSRNSGGDADRKTSFEEDHYRALNRSQDSFQRPSSSSSTPLTPQRFWFDQDLLSSKAQSNNGRLNRFRSFSSYPDLRQHDVQEEEEEEASWGHRQWRFYDDTNLYNYRSSNLDQPPPPPPPQTVERRGGRKEEDGGVDDVKMVPAEDAVVEVEASPLPAPDSPPAPPKTVRRRARRTYEDVGKSERRRKNDLSEITSGSSQPQPPPLPPRPPPSPPRPPSPPQPQTEEFEEGGKKKRGGTSATKEFLISLKRKKKNRQRQKSVENLDSFFNYESSYTLPWIPSPSPPPPPTPPPPPPFFQNLFSSKKRKTKTAPPPPPPPPPRRPVPNSQQLSRKTTVTDTAYITQKPPLPVRIRSYNNAAAEENVNSGGESPLNAIPPPPPLPPFNIPVWKYEVHGDYVRLKSINYSDAEESGSPSSDGGGDTVAPPFCPSPDVNMKADNFIKKFRDGLKLEKLKSVKEKEGRVGRSNLGPGPEHGSEPGPS